jgi:hypothetical protein
MDARAPAAKAGDADREWWLRLVAVLQSPRAVFAALRDDSREAVDARQEPVLLVVLLAAVGGILTSPSAAKLMDNPERDGLVVAVLVFLTALMYGVATYWIGGAAVYLGLRGAGSPGTYRRARHILAFAATPIALSFLVLWPVELAVYGSDLFRSGGADEGAGKVVFDALEGAFVLWALALLVIGVGVVEGWKTVRALGALGLALFVLIGFTLVALILSA